MPTSRNTIWIGYALIAASLVPAAMVGHSLWNWYRARSWVATKASLISVDVVTRTGTGAQGKQTSSTTLSAEYEYDWKECRFHSAAVSPFNHIEVFSGYKRKQAEILRTSAKDGNSVMCFVNPNNPKEAFLRREFRWLSFAVFCVIAVLFFGSGALIVRQQRREWKRL